VRGTQDKDDMNFLFVECRVGGCRVFGHHGDDGRGIVLDRKFMTGLTFHLLWKWAEDWRGRIAVGRAELVDERES
jgi:hypothetical protein